MVALVTGVSSDLGSEIAKKLISKGYYVIGTYLNNFPKYTNEKLKAYKCDITNEEDILNLKSQIESLDIIVNNACYYQDEEIKKKKKEDFMKTLEVNIIGTFLITKYFAPLIYKGFIFNLASTDGIYTQNKFNYDYAASKAGIISLTKSLSLIFPNLNVYTISPNWIATESTLNLDKDYLEEEMKKSGQSRLINKYEICNIIMNIINNPIKSGTNVIIDAKNDELTINYDKN